MEDPLWDFDEDCEAPPNLKWEKEAISPKQFDTLLVAEGVSAVEFAKRCLIEKADPINKILSANVQLYEDRSNSSVLCTSLCDDNVLVADATELLLPWILSAKNVIVLKTVPLVYYKNIDDTEEAYVIRALHTKQSNNIPSDIRTLEQPNILNGIAAGVMNYRDHENLPASVYAYYLQTDVTGLDAQSAQPVQLLMNKLKIPCNRVFATKLKCLSNLYV